MARLDQDKQNEQEPKRIEFAKRELKKAGVTNIFDHGKELRFLHNGNVIKFFPYSGWFTGKGIKDGRGIKLLLNQIVNSKT